VIHPGIQFKSVKGNALLPDRDFHQTGPDLAVEAVPVHAQVERRIPQADQSWVDGTGLFHEQVSCIAFC
jgi:hypothetical protein